MAVCLARSRVSSAVENFVSSKRIPLLRAKNLDRGVVGELLFCRRIYLARDPSTFVTRFSVRGRNVRQNLLYKPPPRRWQSQDSAQAEKSPNSASTKALTGVSFGIIFIGCGAFVSVYGAPKRDAEGNEIKDEYSHLSLPLQYSYRAWAEANAMCETVANPSRDRLLPDPVPAPYIQPPYTLSLEIIGVLVHPEWSYYSGWRFKKRPGVDFFLQQVGPPLFEVIVYTKENGYTAYPIINSLDPQGYVMYRLYRDATYYKDSAHRKALGNLNRPINRVIHVDWDEKAIQDYPHNCVRLQKWDGDMSDRTLMDLAVFLKTIAESGVDDVRGVLKYYSQFDDPLSAFRENQRKLAEQELIAQKAAKEKIPPAWSTFKARL